MGADGGIRGERVPRRAGTRGPGKLIEGVAWQVYYGGDARAFEESRQAAAAEIELPDPPTLPDHLFATWVAFWELSAQRGLVATNIGLIPLPIPPPWMTTWLDEAGVEDHDERERCLWQWCAMDTKYRELRIQQLIDNAPSE